MSTSSTMKAVSELTPSNVYELHAKNYLKEKQVQFGEPKMAKRQSPGRPGDVELSTNVYAVQLKRPIKVYRYDVQITGIKRTDRVVEFTKKFNDDFTQTERRFRCRDVVTSFMNKHRDLAVQAGCMYNDLQAIMYTLQPITPGDQPVEYTFEPEKLAHAAEFVPHKLKNVVLKLTPTKESFGIELKQLEQNLNLMFVNRDLAQFLDIATSQEVFFRQYEDGTPKHIHFSTNTSYLYNPQDFGFTDADSTVFQDNRTYLAIGCEKAIHTVQGPPNNAIAANVGIPALVIQPKKTPFHENGALIEKVMSLLGNNYERSSPGEVVNKLEKNLKGLVVQTTHNPNNTQILTIKGFERKNAREYQFEIGDEQEQITVADYFQQKYQVQLSNWKLPLVITEFIRDGKKQKNYYPIEVLYVCDNQRVKTQHQMPLMISETIKKCAVPPAILREQVSKIAKSLHIWDRENRYLLGAQVTVMNNPLQLQARQLQSPIIGIDPNRTAKPDLDGKWRGAPNRFLDSVGPNEILRVYSWAVVVFLSPSDRSFSELDQFVKNYMTQASSFQVNFPDPIKKDFITNRDDKAIEQYFDDAYKSNCAFILCFHGDNDDRAHHVIKACERRYQVASQCIRIGTARSVILKNQRLTMQNILQKTNVKLGGLNFTLPRSKIATNQTTLIIGFSTNHPAGGLAPIRSDADQSIVTSAPSVVGFAANVGPTKLPFDFIGDFFYQQSRREEKVNLIEDIVTRCLTYFQNARGGQSPQNVILYRDGCSEGQFNMLLKYEIPLLKKALQDHGCNACLTLIVPNKIQNIRFFNRNINARDKAINQNLKPGIVADTTIVHPVFAEFFLNSHSSFQGTARTPKYTVIYDDLAHPLDELEQITYDLCYGHQIIFSPLSLPAPVRIASEYAKRGRNLYNIRISELQTTHQQDLTHEMLNQELSFYGHAPEDCWLAQYRVNA